MNGWRSEAALWRPRADGGTEFITTEALVGLLDSIVTELDEARRQTHALPTPDHIYAQHILESLGRRNAD